MMPKVKCLWVWAAPVARAPAPVGARPLRALAALLRWPAGTLEKLPVVAADFSTAVPGLYVVGDLTGVPLLKFAADSGARAVQAILADPAFATRERRDEVLDLAIVRAGVSGMATAHEARERGLRFQVLEASEAFSTIVNFPKAKPIYTYPTGMTPAGPLQFGARAIVKEGLVEGLREQALGRVNNPTLKRRLWILSRTFSNS